MSNMPPQMSTITVYKVKNRGHEPEGTACAQVPIFTVKTEGEKYAANRKEERQWIFGSQI